uniref:ER membrane protein complex subunit 1 n=1 Tax=Strongyloides papillosus TaxID=174720 RepID=A0A0N5BT52_STREA
MNSSNKYLPFILLITFISISSASDAALKTEWTQKYIGCPNGMLFENFNRKNENLNDLILVTSDNNTLSTLSMNYGTINWRHLFEDSSNELRIASTNKAVFTIFPDGIVRGFKKLTGEMFYEELLASNTVENYNIFIVDNYNVAAIFDNIVYLINTKEKSHNKYNIPKDVKTSVVSIGVLDSESSYHIVFSSADTISLINIKKDDLETQTITKLDKMVVNHRTCAVSGKYLLCQTKDNTQLVYYDGKDVKTLGVDGKLVNKISGVTNNGIFLISGEGFSKIYDLNINDSPVIEKSSPNCYVMSTTDKGYLACLEENNKFVLYNANKLTKPVFSKTLEVDMKNNYSGIKDIFFTVREIDGDISVFVAMVANDCQIDFYETAGEESFTHEWTRYEDLSYISQSDFIDLPLSEMDMLFEKEFSNPDGSIISNFTLRITSQIEQSQTLVRKYLRYVSKFLGKINFKTLSTAGFMSGLKNKKQELFDDDQPLERDYFKFKKYIIATTLKGSIYAINNENGNVVWKISIGSNFVPLTDILNNLIFPFFIQRTTDSSMFRNQGVVTYGVIGGKTGILAFNMITGEILEQKIISKKLIRVEQIPKQNSERMKNLILFFGEQPNDIEYYPPLKESDIPLYDKPFYLLWISRETGQLRGTRFDFKKKYLQTVWVFNRNMGDEYIGNIVGKQVNEKTQSLGYVIGHNNVLYKYLNPHMIAIAFASKKTQHVTEVIILDTITGKTLYSSKLKGAQMPFKMVLCDNWLAMSFYNSKTRRQQMSVVELFDGHEFKDVSSINLWSKSYPSNFSVQSYLFPQGVTAFSVTKTDIGLTTRSLLVGMPFGSIAQISKRQLDGRRVFDVTQEQREEGLVQYIPELIFTPDQYVTGNNTVLQIRQISSHSAGLESVSHIFAFGKDLYCTYIYPSGKFDMLHDDFNYHLIIAILVSLVLGSILTRYKANYHSLKQSWM